MSELQTTTAAPAAPAPGAPPAAPAEGEVDQTAQNTAEQAPATATDGEKPKTTGQDPEKQSSRRFERRLDRAYKRAAEAQARAELLAKENDELKSKLAPPAADAATGRPSRPKLHEFSDVEVYERAIEKYEKDLAKFESDRAVKDFQTKQHGETQKQQQTRLIEAWETKTAKADEKYDDFEEVVGDLKPNTPWAVAIMEADNGDDIAYYLGKHEDEARRIMALPPVAQIRAIGRLEAKLAAEPPKPKTPSKAPAPISPLTGAAPVTTDTPSDNDDIGAWIKKRTKQVYGKRR